MYGREPAPAWSQLPWRSRRTRSGCRRCDPNVLMLGPQCAGKSMLARRFTTILPAMTLDEAIETIRIHSVAGLTGAPTALITTRPFRAPHHTIFAVGLIGGGPVPQPGELSLAHHGVLLLDERPEFRRHVLEVRRQPLEKSITRIQSPARPPPDRTGGAGSSDQGAPRTAPILLSTCILWRCMALWQATLPRWAHLQLRSAPRPLNRWFQGRFTSSHSIQ
jgi:hypothetical protein